MKKYRVIAYPDEYGKPRKEKIIQAENHKEAERIAFRLFPEYHEVGAFEMEDN